MAYGASAAWLFDSNPTFLALLALLCGLSAAASDLAETNQQLRFEVEALRIENGILKRALPRWRELLDAPVDLVDISVAAIGAPSRAGTVRKQTTSSSRFLATRRLLGDASESPCSADEIQLVVAAGSKATVARAQR